MANAAVGGAAAAGARARSHPADTDDPTKTFSSQARYVIRRPHRPQRRPVVLAAVLRDSDRHVAVRVPQGLVPGVLSNSVDAPDEPDLAPNPAPQRLTQSTNRVSDHRIRRLRDRSRRALERGSMQRE